VSGNIAVELFLLLWGRQLSVQKQVAHIHEVGILGKFGDRIAAVQKNARLTSMYVISDEQEAVEVKPGS
jgi:hypothetical protein